MKRYFFSLLGIPVLAGAIVLQAAGLAGAAQGGFSGEVSSQQGGFTGPGPALSSVQQAQAMRDDSHVTLQGNIIQHLGKDKYLFRDQTGTITVEIDHDKWGGQTVGPDDRVEIQGEVDKDWNSVEIDVKRLIKK